MKNKLIFSLCSIILLSSCASKLGIQKRRYNKGLHIDLVQNHSSQSASAYHPKIKSEKLNITFTETVSTNEVSEPVVKELLVQPEVFASSSVRANNFRPVDLSRIRKAEEKLMRDTKTETKQIAPAFIQEKRLSSPKADTNKILLIILCIFPILCLIAVYLHDGGINLNFWIALLLHLTVVLYWLFPLLVVLDVVDLS